MSKNLKSVSVYLSLMSIAVGMGACAPQDAQQVSHQQESENAQAPRDMSESFSSVNRRLTGRSARVGQTHLVSGDLGTESSEFLVIKKAALGKEFLMSSSLIPQNESPTSGGLQGRVVSFKKVGKRVFLVEATEGHVISPTLPASLILAEIPVTEDRADELVLDFNSGMNKIFMAGNWWASDLEGKAYSAELQQVSLPIEVSYLDTIRNVGADREILEIRQIAQAVMPMNIMRPTLEVRYYLRAYEKNANYKARESNSNFNNVGYFETPPSLEKNSGRAKIYNTFFDTSKPVTFYVSANTPVEFQESIKEGILYWNKAFNKEVLRAEIAPAYVTAPDPTRNLVQWVEFDNAGFAYADALMDPRSGEIKHAQVYLTSAFAFISKIRARQLLRILGAEKKEEKKDGEKKLSQHKMFAPYSLKGMKPEALCDYDKSESIANLIETVLAESAASGVEITDAALLRVSQDYIREVTAHEIGHTLGLRHNFAGNLASTFSPKERADAVKNYIHRSQLDNPEVAMTTSSVMEYTDYQDAVLNGAIMKARKTALPYDIKSINYAYLDPNAKLDADKTLFCTDSHADKYLDCTRNDSSANSLEYIAASIQDILGREAYRFVEAFLAAKSNVVVVDRRPVNKVSVSPAAAVAVGNLTTSALAWMNASNRSLRVDRSFDRLDSLNTEDVLVARLKDLQGLIKGMGGKTAPSLLAAMNIEAMGADSEEMKSNSYAPTADWKTDFLAKVKDYLDRPDVKKFVGQDGETYELTSEETEQIKAYAKKYADKFSELAVTGTLTAISKATLDLEVKALKYKLEKDNLTEAMEERIAEISSKVLTTVGGSDNVKYKTATFVVPKYLYSQDERIAAAKALSSKQAPLPQWNEAKLKAAKSAITRELSQAINVEDITKIEAATYDGNRPFQLWLKDHSAVYNSL
jgi:hypothetical protein